MKKVFVSSVVEGFEAYREAANKAVSLTGNLRWLVGQRYGFVPEADRVSVTHREFLTARETGKTILVFVQSGEKEPEQAAFCKTVEDYSLGFFRAEFSAPTELTEQIVQSLVQLDAEAKAEPEESFQSLVEQSREILSRNWQLGTNNEPLLEVAFWRQPPVINDIIAIERGADEVFQQTCKAGLATLRGGYDVIADAEYTAFKAGDNVLAYFGNGLILFRLNPKITREGFDHDLFFIAPSRVRELLVGAGEFFAGRAAWVSMRLTGMQSRNFEELPQQRQGSVSLGGRWGNTEKETSRLFSPYTPVEYQQWIDNSIELMKRVFGC